MLAALEIKAGADISDLEKNLAKGESSVKDFAATITSTGNVLKKFETELRKSTDPKDIKRLQESIGSLKGKLEVLNSTQNNLLGTQSKFVQGTNQANNALTNLGRVAQDAPFGFIGIQNNLNPLLESFQRLKTETGSTGSALKALGGSLVGAGGLGLALSVVSSLWLVFGDSLTGVSAEAKKASEQYSQYVDTLGSGIGTAQKEIAQSTALVSIINDVSQSTSTRTRALKELKEQYPKYNELQNADINSTNILAAFQDKLAKSLVRRAKAAAFADLIAKESVAIFKLQNESITETSDKASILAKGYAFVAGTQGYANANIIKYTSGLKETNKEIDRGKTALLSYEKALNDVTLEQIKAGDEVGKSEGKEKKAAKEKLTYLQELENILAETQNKYNLRIIGFDEFIKNNNAAYNKALEQAIKVNAPQKLVQELVSKVVVLPNAVGNEQLALPIRVAPKLIVDEQAAREANASVMSGIKGILTPLPNQMTDLEKSIRETVTSTYSNAFSGMGEAIAGAVNGGNLFEGLFNGIANSLGEGLVNIGKQMILASTLLKALTASFGAGNFGKSLVGGIALVALGSVLKSIKIGKNAQGTDYWKGGLTMVGERGPELINLPRGASVTPNHEMGAIGGGSNVEIAPVTVFRGTDLIIYFNRVSQLNSRIG